MSDSFVTRPECKSNRDDVEDHCRERTDVVKGDVDKLGESHRRLEDRLNGLDEKVDKGFLRISEQNAGMYKALAGSIFMGVLSLLGIVATLYSTFNK